MNSALPQDIVVCSPVRRGPPTEVLCPVLDGMEMGVFYADGSDTPHHSLLAMHPATGEPFIAYDPGLGAYVVSTVNPHEARMDRELRAFAARRLRGSR
jgi:hypothetical protein